MQMKELQIDRKYVNVISGDIVLTGDGNLSPGTIKGCSKIDCNTQENVKFTPNMPEMKHE